MENFQKGRTNILKMFIQTLWKREINLKSKKESDREMGGKAWKAPGMRIGVILFNVNINSAQWRYL